MTLQSFVSRDGEPVTWRRDAVWIVPKGKALLCVPVMADGTYDDEAVRVLPRSDPWHKVARKLLRYGGQAVERPAGDDDRHLATLLLQSGSLTPARGAILRPGANEEGHCFTNAQELLSHLPGATLELGLALLYDLWALHAWLLRFGRILETSSPVAARYYYGAPYLGCPLKHCR